MTLTDKERARVLTWYLAHMLAEENSAEDDALADRIRPRAGTRSMRRRPTKCLTTIK